MAGFIVSSTPAWFDELIDEADGNDVKLDGFSAEKLDGFDPAKHPRGTNGRFVDVPKTANEGKKTVNPKKLKTLSAKELQSFIQKHKNSKDNVRASLGNVTEDANKRIKAKTGFDVRRILIDSGDMRHALKKESHWIEPKDFEKLSSVINNTNTIIPQGKLHQNNKTAIFVEEVNNGINFVMEFRSGKGDLALVTAYRVKKDGQTH